MPAYSGTFHLDYREADGRRRRPAIGDDPTSVKRAMATQAHVLELRRHGVDVDDSPDVRGDRLEGETLQEIAAAWKKSPPARLARRSVAKYSNAISSFVEWAKEARITHAVQ